MGFSTRNQPAMGYPHQKRKLPNPDSCLSSTHVFFPLSSTIFPLPTTILPLSTTISLSHDYGNTHLFPCINHILTTIFPCFLPIHPTTVTFFCQGHAQVVQNYGVVRILLRCLVWNGEGERLGNSHVLRLKMLKLFETQQKNGKSSGKIDDLDGFLRCFDVL